MKKKLILLIILSSIIKVNSQNLDNFGFSFGIGKNVFLNNTSFDKKHFNFDSPLSTSFGIQYIKSITPNNSLVVKLNYTTKKIKYNYKLNEPNIPYEVFETTIEKYAVTSLAIGYRKSLTILNKTSFIQVDFVSDFNIFSSVSNTGSGNNTSNTSSSETINYTSFNSNFLGENKVSFSNNFSFGIILGKRKQFELSANVNIPYNSLQNKTNLYSYTWKYENKTYNHVLNYKGKIFYPNLIFTMYVFKK